MKRGKKVKLERIYETNERVQKATHTREIILENVLSTPIISPVRRESLKKEKVDIGANQQFNRFFESVHCGVDSWEAVHDRLKKKKKLQN